MPLIVSAGVNYDTLAPEYSAEEVEHATSINVTGALVTAQAAACPTIRLKHPGSIRIVASISGIIANKRRVHTVSSSDTNTQVSVATLQGGSR